MFAQKSAHPVRYPEQSTGSAYQPETQSIGDRSSLVYNPRETRDEFLARQRRAYDAGRRAWQERRIPAYLIPFYETLVERVGANSYTWVSEETLAEAFQVDVSTIKRWIARLVRVGLIRRQRQFATSSRTYLTAYDATTELLDGQAAAIPATDSRATPPTPDQVDSHTPTPEEQSVSPTDVSFRRIDKPSFGANLRRDSKIDH
ncbi:MAG TPA: helix-turn-helix domain-containing protein, partial [Longimicrobiales bacterium]